MSTVGASAADVSLADAAAVVFPPTSAAVLAPPCEHLLRGSRPPLPLAAAPTSAAVSDPGDDPAVGAASSNERCVSYPRHNRCVPTTFFPGRRLRCCPSLKPPDATLSAAAASIIASISAAGGRLHRRSVGATRWRALTTGRGNDGFSWQVLAVGARMDVRDRSLWSRSQNSGGKKRRRRDAAAMLWTRGCEADQPQKGTRPRWEEPAAVKSTCHDGRT